MNEEKREQLLKRILPGLVIVVIYFVFVSGIVSEKMKKAETDYKNLFSSGVSKEALPGVISQQQQSQQHLGELEQKVSKNKAELKKLAGFLAHAESTNATSTLLSTILAKQQLKVRHDEQETLKPEQLSPALKEVWQQLTPSTSDGKKTQPLPTAAQNTEKKDISVYHLWLSGSYQNMYQALMSIVQNKLPALPVSLTMTMPETGRGNSGELEWELILWM